METITFKTETEYLAAIHGDDHNFQEYKDEKLTNFDSEKGNVDVQAFLQRVSDGKKFTTSYTRFGQGEEGNDEGYEFEEVVVKVKKVKVTEQSILDEMDSDMEESGMTQGEIVSCLNHWKNKYLITKRK